MGYRNKTYVIFDGDEDMWAYAYMLGWKKNKNIDFNFHDAHDIRKIVSATNEAYIKGILRDRLDNTKQAIVLVGPLTKTHHRFVRWEIETCLNLDIPIVVVNLNKKRAIDNDLCPPILKGTCSIHVAFGARIIKHALDDFCENFHTFKGKSDWYYYDETYKALGYE
jgi:hypothetical protein